MTVLSAIAAIAAMPHLLAALPGGLPGALPGVHQSAALSLLAGVHRTPLLAGIRQTPLPPFSWNPLDDARAMLGYDFMRNAFIAGTAVALVAGLAGYFVVLRQLAFAGDALSHLAFTGALGAVLLNLDPLVGVFGLTALGGLAIGGLGERARARDVAVGTVLAWTLGLGALFLSIYTTSASAASSALGVKVLFGSLLGIQPGAARLAALVAGGVIVALIVIARPLLFASVDPEVARARRVPVRLVEAVFLVLLAATVGESTQVVGALLIFALLVTPAAIARRLVARPYWGMALAALVALVITWVGLTLAFYTPYPVSFLISALAFLGYVAVVAGQRVMGRWMSISAKGEMGGMARMRN